MSMGNLSPSFSLQTNQKEEKYTNVKHILGALVTFSVTPPPSKKLYTSLN
jgi:hypothetical protein